ncbi:MmyB family transcriptional regulator [Streptomyces nodosus]|uniref:MmyB family transcriptional regulator n=1 Tax=Streptomyces nodosus TaxID=40318 RepID=UPI00380B5C58
MRHPEVGELVLHREKLIVAGSDGQVLVVYHAEEGTASADALALLGTLAVSREPDASGPECDPGRVGRRTAR